jgi:hypothetical protein
MKFALLIPLVAVTLMAHSNAQSRIFRCGNTYTNDAVEARSQGCRAMEGGNVTVVEGTRVNTSTAPRVASASQSAREAAPQPQNQPRVDNADQRARDSDARLILDSELKKAEARRAELLKEYNNGEPEKLGPETRNHQKYLDRVAELKASIARIESDIAGIRRELGRNAPTASK